MGERPIINTALLHALNPEYAQAVARGDRWALQHAERVRSINAGEPEGSRRQFDGKPRRWCGAACTAENGCITCTLPEDHEQGRRNRNYPRQPD